ncbi:MAG: hypothetical protein MK310_03990 [Rhodobacterales bacterium]|nr:hypothetical protein [Rhodobacterales bacterium]
MKGDHNDPKALIRESFNIEGIKIEECRSIFLDWALSLPNDADAGKIIPLLIEQYGDKQEHPMLVTLKEGMIKTVSPIRRGGRKGRLTN